MAPRYARASYADTRRAAGVAQILKCRCGYRLKAHKDYKCPNTANGMTFELAVPPILGLALPPQAGSDAAAVPTLLELWAGEGRLPRQRGCDAEVHWYVPTELLPGDAFRVGGRSCTSTGMIRPSVVP